MKSPFSTPIFSLIFLFFLILLNGIGATLPVPSLTLIAEYYHFPLIVLIEAIFVLFSTSFLIIWGYAADKFERKQLIWVANIIWIIPSATIYLSPRSLVIYVLGRIGMAIGLSAYSPVAYSILADFAPYEKRGIISSGLNLTWVGSSAAGILIGGFFSYRWFHSFGFVSLLGIIVLFLLYFFNVPLRAKQEPAFVKFRNYEYIWRIDIKSLSSAFKSKTIKWLLIQGIFALIPGTFFTYWLVSFLSSSEGLGISVFSASIIAIIIASGRAIGYPIFGGIGDRLSSKNDESLIRAKIASICMASQAFFFFLSILVINSFLINFLLFSLFFWLGSFIGAASGPNRTALLFNVSLPENRGSLGSLLSITDQVGVVIGIILSSIWLQSLGFKWVFILSLGFYFVAAFAWSLSFPHIQRNCMNIQQIMNSRAEKISLKEL